MPLRNLPCEIQLILIDHLNGDADLKSGLIQLSNTCSFYRSLISPHLFSSITLRNKQIGSAARDLITTGRIRHHVKRLHFIGSAPGNNCYDSGYDEDLDETAYILPKTVRSILADLTCFPNLQTLTVQFDYGFKDQAAWSYVTEIFDEPETEWMVDYAEKTEPWRSLMAKVWDALIQNQSPGFKELCIRRMIPKEVSSYRKPEFAAFLNSMERFSLTAHGNVTGQRDNALEGNRAFYSQLGGFMFDHLTSLTHLTLTASETGPLGLSKETFPYCLSLPLDASQMPLVESLHLEGLWVCPELSKFLASRAGTLKSITLRDCVGHGPSEEDMPDLRWAHLFKGLADTSLQSLKRFIVEPRDAPLFDAIRAVSHESFEEVEEVRSFRGLQERHPERRVFAYQYCDEKTALRWNDGRVNRAAFLRSEDQAQYDRLMRVVRANAR